MGAAWESGPPTVGWAKVMIFTDKELEYLQSQRLARIATASATGEPDVAAVGFRVNGDDVVVGGLDLTKTRKYYNAKATGRASLVVDDLASVDPWRPRLVKVTGSVDIGTDDRGNPTIRIHPETVWSFGLGDEGRPDFGGMKREVG
jgi:pyridoxamine 5'-phosphate oxidase family protein